MRSEFGADETGNTLCHNKDQEANNNTNSWIIMGRLITQRHISLAGLQHCALNKIQLTGTRALQQISLHDSRIPALISPEAILGYTLGTE